MERRLPSVCLPRLHPLRADRGQQVNSTSSQKLEIHKNTARCTSVTLGAFKESDTGEREKVQRSGARLKSLVVAPGLISWCRSSRSIPATDSIPWSITATECGHHWYHYSSGRPMLWSRILEQKKTEINSWQSLRLLSVYNQKLYSSSVALCV